MCGRINQVISPEEIAEYLHRLRVKDAPTDYRPSYNVAPTQSVLTVAKRDGQRVARSMRWGLIPAWAKDTKIGNRLINARSESIAEKPAYRDAFKHRRGLVIVSGYYEWRTESSGPKTPFRILREDNAPFAIAAVWERWRPRKSSRDEDIIESCAVLTRQANTITASIHERMPIIVEGGALDVWLDPISTKDDLKAVMEGEISGLTHYEVSRLVNSPANDSPVCIKPLSLLQQTKSASTIAITIPR